MMLWNSVHSRNIYPIHGTTILCLTPEMEPTQKLQWVRSPLFQGVTPNLQHGLHVILSCPQSLQWTSPQFYVANYIHLSVFLTGLEPQQYIVGVY